MAVNRSDPRTMLVHSVHVSSNNTLGQLLLLKLGRLGLSSLHDQAGSPRMDSLMHLVHRVFAGHGYQQERDEESKSKLRSVVQRAQKLLSLDCYSGMHRINLIN